jgi:endonuclease III
VLTPQRLLETGWKGLVKILDEGGYTRYDFKTADKLLEVMQNLSVMYNGMVSLIHEQAADSKELENRIRELGKGVGEVTANIFLRELRGVWEKADSNPTVLAILAASKLKIVKNATPAGALKQLKAYWSRNQIAGKSFVNFETALLRLGKDFYRKGKCPAFLSQ